MNNRERFQAVVRFETPDYVPIFGFPGAAGVSRSYWTSIRSRLVETGMPARSTARSAIWLVPATWIWLRWTRMGILWNMSLLQIPVG